ncbi:PhzF family isomerase [Clostridioides difficile]
MTKEKFTGNPAGVITNADGLSESQIQKITRELNNSETAFIFNNLAKNHQENYDVHIRFFTPTNEVPICGHATIAAHYVRAVENQFNNKTVFQKTGAGILPVDIIKKDNDYEIIMTQGKIEVSPPLQQTYQKRLLNAFGILKEDICTDCPIAISSTGHSKVMIGIKELSTLNSLSPNLYELSKISQEIKCNGYYIFTLHNKETLQVHGRMFAPAIGISEDPVTGNANGPLGAYLVHYKVIPTPNTEFIFEAVQGEAIKRKGKMLVKVIILDNKPVEVKIIGKAVIAFSTNIEI